MQGRVITAGNRAGRSDPHIRQVQGSVLCRLRGKIPLQHPPRSKRSPHLLVSTTRITHGYARGPWPGSQSEDPHVVIAPAQTETSPVDSRQFAAPGRAGVGLYPIEASHPLVDSSTPRHGPRGWLVGMSPPSARVAPRGATVTAVTTRAAAQRGMTALGLAVERSKAPYFLLGPYS